jgi:hypothetical protein
VGCEVRSKGSRGALIPVTPLRVVPSPISIICTSHSKCQATTPQPGAAQVVLHVLAELETGPRTPLLHLLLTHLLTTTTRMMTQRKGEVPRVGSLVVRGGKPLLCINLLGTCADCGRWGVSGLSVQNPDSRRPPVPGGSTVRDLLRRAAECVISPIHLCSNLTEVRVQSGPCPRSSHAHGRDLHWRRTHAWE